MITKTCWQYLKKKQIEEDSSSKRSSFRLDRYEIESLEYGTARDFILSYEWLGNMGTSKYCYGLSFGGDLASVVCYGPLVAPTHYASLLGLEHTSQIIQVCRGATSYWAPRWVPSKLISSTLKRMHRMHGALVAIAYADPKAGEIGTIYQACNAYYLGMTSPGGAKRYIIKGHSYDPRKVHKKFGSRAHKHLEKIDPNYRVEPIRRKHRYLFLLGSGRQKSQLLLKIESLIEPYPKRNIP